MIIHEYLCGVCGHTQEAYVSSDVIPNLIECDCCSSPAKKIVSMSDTAPVDSPWLNEVLKIVDKKSDAPHNTEFLKHPSRANYEAWKKGTGLRHLEPGEGIPKVDKTAQKATIKNKMIQKIQERNAITVRT